MVLSDSLRQAPSLGNGYNFYLWSKGFVKINTLNFLAYSGWRTDVVLHIKPLVTRLITLWACTWWTDCFQNLQSHRPWWIPDSWVDDTCKSLRILPLWFQSSVFRNSSSEKYMLRGHLASFFIVFFRIQRQLCPFLSSFLSTQGNSNLGYFCWQTWQPSLIYMGCKKSFWLELHSLIGKN